MICERLDTCPFVKCCSAYEKSTAAKGFINIYCKSKKMEQCVRKILSNKFGPGIVPKNMMPNGSPIPKTSTDDWCDKALNYRKYL
ncbi:MAG: hypothetical protein U9N10_09050 [Bacillota bacterium]|nr:hypothetical protein [Bacillota bacterium]